jgi:hypothetical protein
MNEGTPVGGKADENKHEDPADGAGEDEGSTSHDGKDGHLKDDQKPTTK